MRGAYHHLVLPLALRAGEGQHSYTFRALAKGFRAAPAAR
jgi:hypothetical protein